MYTTSMQESSLHASLKQFYTQDGGFTEYWIDGFWIDIYKDGSLYEVQTDHFNSIRFKLERLLENYPVRVIYPIAFEKTIIVRDIDQSVLRQRKSPKHGRIENVFYQLVYISELIIRSNFSLEVLLTSEIDERMMDGNGSWKRRGVSLVDRKLVGIINRKLFVEPKDFKYFIPQAIENDFTTSILATSLGIPNRLATKMAYCLRNIRVIERFGKVGNSFRYRVI